jgi:hypothetical protein
MDEIMIPMRKLGIECSEFAAFKACLLFNPDACDLSTDVKDDIIRERTKYLSALFFLLTSKHGLQSGAQKYGTLLMMTSSIQNIIDTNDENMQIMVSFGVRLRFWVIFAFLVKSSYS